MSNLSLKVSLLHLSNMFHCQLIFSITNTLKSFREERKGQVRINLLIKMCVYKISYNDCEAMSAKQKEN